MKSKYSVDVMTGTTVYSVMDNSGETIAYSKRVLMGSEYTFYDVGDHCSYYQVKSIAHSGDDPEVVLVSSGPKMRVDEEGQEFDINAGTKEMVVHISDLIFMLEVDNLIRYLEHRKGPSNKDVKQIIKYWLEGRGKSNLVYEDL